MKAPPSPPEVCTKISASVLSSLMTMTVDLMDAILAGFSVEMILIAQTVFFMLILCYTSADVMNIIVAITVVLKCAPECIKMQHVNATFRRRKYKRQTPQTTFLDTGLQELSHSNIIQIVKRQIVTVTTSTSVEVKRRRKLCLYIVSVEISARLIEQL